MIKNYTYLASMVLLITSGCASVQKSPDSTTAEDDGIGVHDEGVEIDPFYKVPDKEDDDNYGQNDAPHISTNPTSGTVLALLSQAKEQEQAGNPEKAAAVLERALRIEPRNAELWYRLALLRLQQGQLDLAKSFASKSTALAQDNDALQLKNRTIIEQVDLLQGSR